MEHVTEKEKKMEKKMKMRTEMDVKHESGTGNVEGGDDAALS